MIDKNQIKSALPIAKLLEYYKAQKAAPNQYWCLVHEQGGKSAGHKTASLVLHPASQTVTCKSQSCFEGDNIFGVIAKMENLDIKNDYPKILTQAAGIGGIKLAELPKQQPSFSLNGVTSLTEEHKKYLHGRGFSDETIVEADFRSLYDKIVYLYKTTDGAIVGYKAKTVYPKNDYPAVRDRNPQWIQQFVRGKQPDIWHLEDCAKKEKIYLVAGEYDAAIFYQELKKQGLVDRFGVFTMTTGEATKVDDGLIDEIKKWAGQEFRIIYDFDTAGINNMPKRAQELLKTGKKVFTFNWNDDMNPDKTSGFDINDYFLKHGNLDLFLDQNNFTENIAGTEEIEIANYKLIHPSVDIRDDIALFGFRALMKDDKWGNIFLVSSNGQIKLTLSDKLTVANNEYRVDLRNRLLEPLEERWVFSEIKEFIKNPTLQVDALQLVHGLLKKYVELPDERDYLLLAAWIIGTYLYRVFWSYPFIHLKAPKQSGKSQFLDLLNKLSFNSKKARATFAALVDTVDSLRGTYIIDQADSLGNPTKEDILEILTDSYKTEGGKRRMIDMGNRGERQVVESETYSPKAFASTKELPEDLRDRFFVLPVIKSSKNYPIPNEQNEPWCSIRGHLYKFALLKYRQAQEIYKNVLEKYRLDSVIVGRKAELWIPLESILTLAGCGPEQIERAKFLFLERYGFTQYTPFEDEIILMKAIVSLFKKSEAGSVPSTVRTTTKDIVAAADAEEVEEIEEEYRKKLPQKAGWLIKKFNLTVEPPKRWGKGMVYILDKQKVDKIYAAYFQSLETPTEPTPAPTDEQISEAVKVFGGEVVNEIKPEVQA